MDNEIRDMDNEIWKPIATVTFDRDILNEIVEKAKAEILESIARPQGEWIV